MSPVPPASPAAPLLATALLVILLTITALSVRLCLATGAEAARPWLPRTSRALTRSPHPWPRPAGARR